MRQNELPETNVKITGLNAEFYKLKVIFSNTSIGEKNFNLYMNTGTETSYSIRKNNKGEYVIRLVSEVPIAQAVDQQPTQTVIKYHDNPAAAPVVGTITQHTETTSQSATTAGDMSGGAQITDNDANITISPSGKSGEDEKAHTTVVHTTTTTTHTFVSRPSPIHPASYLTGYTGPIGCPVPLSSDEFTDMKATIADKKFEDTRMSIAKQTLSDRCVFSDHVKEVMLFFTFEENRLEFAKYAYDFTYDIGNYANVNDAFKFESSTEELNKFLQSRK